MDELTKYEALTETYKMWDWIAQKTLERKQIVSKRDYMVETNYSRIFVLNDCFLCEYVGNNFCNGVYLDCTKCPISWEPLDKMDGQRSFCNYSDYGKWATSIFWEDAHKYAIKIRDRAKMELKGTCNGNNQ